MTRLNTPKLQSLHPPTAELLWRTYDQLGWQLLERQFEPDQLARAQSVFEQAREIAASFPAGDARLGRSLAGLAWALYRYHVPLPDSAVQAATETLPAPFASSTDEQAVHEIRQLADLAVQILAAAHVQGRDREFLARAHHIRGLLLVELCDGASAEQAFANAGQIYRQLQMTEHYLDVTLWRAKLMQCRRQFREAVVLFQKIVEDAQDIERRFAAMVELANTFLWLGRIREAKQQQSAWARLAQMLKGSFDETQVSEQLLRGELIFTRINILFGDFDVAQNLLAQAQGRLCECNGVSALCSAVTEIVQAELAVAQGNLRCLPESFGKQDERLEAALESQSCLDVLAIDACCQLNVVTTCTPTIVRKHCLFRRRACRVIFASGTTVVVQPIDVEAILRAIRRRVQGEWLWQAGWFETARTELESSVKEIRQHVDASSPMLPPILTLQAKVALEQRKSETQLEAFSLESVRIASQIQASSHPIEAARLWVLAVLRFQEGEYDLAALLIEKSLRHGNASRDERHPQQQFGLLLAAFARAASSCIDCVSDESTFNAAAKPPAGECRGSTTGAPDCRPSNSVRDELDTIYAAMRVLSDTQGCDDYRLLAGKNLSAWLCLYAGGQAFRFESLIQAWDERDRRMRQALISLQLTTAPIGLMRDPRQSLATLGKLANQIQSGVITCPEFEQEPPPGGDPFAEFQELVRDGASWPDHQIAKELNRLTEILCCARLQDAMACFLAKAESLERVLPPQWIPTLPPRHRQGAGGANNANKGRSEGGLLQRLRNRIRSRRNP